MCNFFQCLYLSQNVNVLFRNSSYELFGWWTKVYVWKRSGSSNVSLHRFCLTKGSTLNSQESHPRSVVYVSKPTRAIWRYLLSEFRALLCLSSAQLENNIAKIFRFFHILWDLQKLSFEKEGTVVLAEWSWALLVYNSQEFWIKSEKNCRLCLRNSNW